MNVATFGHFSEGEVFLTYLKRNLFIYFQLITLRFIYYQKISPRFLKIRIRCFVEYDSNPVWDRLLELKIPPLLESLVPTNQKEQRQKATHQLIIILIF